MYKIAVIPGDGIGTEVINSGVEVLQALSKVVPNLPIEFNNFKWGAEYYKKVINPSEQELLNHKEFLKKNLKKNFF